MLRRSAFPLAALLLSAALAGCGPSFQNIRAVTKSSVLVLPARDAVQNGTWHEREGGKSGTMLTDKLAEDLSAKGWKVLKAADPAFTNREVPKPEQQIAEAKKLGADYVLYAMLGEFLDAAPFTFRPDFVFLQEATLTNVKTGEVDWKLAEPQQYSGGNPGSVWRFLPDIAEDIAGAL